MGGLFSLSLFSGQHPSVEEELPSGQPSVGSGEESQCLFKELRDRDRTSLVLRDIIDLDEIIQSEVCDSGESGGVI
jgi:hypothetical protein